jgi:carbonic anhydrase
LSYTLTNTGVKASIPDDACTNPTVEIPGIDGVYQALQFHIHASSEHIIDDTFFGAELHIVHKEVNGDRYAVVGMMIEPDSDEENDIFGQLLDGWQVSKSVGDNSCAVERGGNRKMASETPNKKYLERRLAKFSPYDLLPEGVTFYHYDGGLTTPPCSEVVWWNLADKPVSISPSQYNQLLNQVLHYIDPSTCQRGTNAGPRGITSRPVQPLNGRTVERVCPAGFGYGLEAAKPDCPKETETKPVEVEEVEETESSASSYSLSTLVAASVAAAAYFF